MKKESKVTEAKWELFHLKCTPCPFPPLKSKLMFMKFNYSGLNPDTYTNKGERK